VIPIRDIARRLAREYGRPRHGNPVAALDDLVYVLLSRRTSMQAARDALRRIRSTFGSWDRVLRARSRLDRILTPLGFGPTRAEQLREILRELKRRYGRPTLRPLQRAAPGMRDEEILARLVSLPGIGPKTARCVMMYTMGRSVFPSDAHCFRVLARLGMGYHGSCENLQADVERQIPPRLRYSLHVTLIAHGRAVCVPGYPRCTACKLFDLCKKKTH
jgi:endonuclease III